MKSNESFDFGASLKELEAITTWFEAENIDLDEGLVKFERGMELAGLLKAYLATTQNQVEKIKLKFDQIAPATAEPPAEAEPNTQLF